MHIHPVKDGFHPAGFGGPRFGAGRGLINRPPGPALFAQPPPFGMHFIPNGNFLPAQQPGPPFPPFLPFGQPLLAGGPPAPVPGGPPGWGGQPRHFLPPEAHQAPYQAQMAAGDVAASAKQPKASKKKVTML